MSLIVFIEFALTSLNASQASDHAAMPPATTLCLAIRRPRRGLINTLPAVWGRARADAEQEVDGAASVENAARGM